MKRRVLIAKALAHEPRLLFLDEPTAGVDVELRQSMWAVVEELRKDGVTIILTTHYMKKQKPSLIVLRLSQRAAFVWSKKRQP